MFRILSVFGLSLSLALLMCQGVQSETFESDTFAPPPLEPSPFIAETAPTTAYSPALSNCCTTCCGFGCGRHGHVQMPPHYPYFPAMHGYYYFRPYNGSMLRPQQMTAVGWGADSRAPYDNEIFQQVYAEAEAGLR